MFTNRVLIVWNKSAASDAFAESVKMTNHTGQWNTELVW